MDFNSNLFNLLIWNFQKVLDNYDDHELGLFCLIGPNNIKLENSLSIIIIISHKTVISETVFNYWDIQSIHLLFWGR